MENILHTPESIHTRLKWSVDFDCEFHQNISDWEDLIFQKSQKNTRKETIQLIKQCRVVGLFRMANDFEMSLGEITEKERKLIY